MKKLLLYLILVPGLSFSQNAAELLVRWDLGLTWGGYIQEPTYHNNSDTNLSVGNVSGNNISMAVDDDGFTGSGWPTSSTAPDYSKYYQVALTPLPGKNLKPKNFRFQQNGYCKKFQVRYSTNPSFPGNGTLLMQNDNAQNVQNQYINIAFPANVTVASGQTLYIRIYGYQRQNGSTWRIKSYWNSDWNWNGVVDSPEFYGILTNSITANPDTAATLQGQPVTINVINNDVAELTTINTVSIVSQSANGLAVVQPNKKIIFTPFIAYVGTTTFQYKITAANGTSSTATVTVTVTPMIPVIANNDTAALIKNTTAAINVLGNDVAGSGLIGSASIAALPLHGTVTMLNNIASYTPYNNYVGTDSFTYTVTDSYNNAASATVSLTISEPVLPQPGFNTGIYCPSSTMWDGTQWSNGVPNANKDVIFTGSYTQSGGTLTACSLYVTGAAQVLFEDESNAVITHSVNVAETASLTFESSSNLMQLQNTPNTGNVTIKRFGSKLKRLDYTFWSSPVTGLQTLEQFSPATMSNRFYIYNTPNDSYSAVPPATTTFITGRSYLIRMPNEIAAPQAQAYASGAYRFSFEGVFTGVPNNGNISIPLQYVSESNCFNGVGNPYPSPISITDFILANINNIEGTIWVWRKTNNPDETSYCTITTLGFIANNALGGGGESGNDGNDLVADPWQIDPEGVLNTGQGFIVKAKNSQNLIFSNSMRKLNNYANFFRNADVPEEEEPNNGVVASRIWLNLTNSSGSVFTQALVGYTDLATLEYDNGIDGTSFLNGSVCLYSVIDAAKLVIQGRPAFTINDTVTLGYICESAGEYLITLDHADGLFLGDQDIYIKDNITGAIHNIKESEYVFTSEAGTFDNRFEIVYTMDALGIPDSDIEHDITIINNGQQIQVQSPLEIKSITIFDVTGKELYQDNSINKFNYHISDIPVSNQIVGVYVELEDNSTVIKKILLK